MESPSSLGGMTLELTRPGMLWSLVALLPIGWYFWRSLSDFPLWQRWVSLITRSALLTCLTLALAGLTLLYPTQRMFVVLAIDRSQSVDAEANKRIDAVVDAVRHSASSGQQAMILEFAGQPSQPRAVAEETPTKAMDDAETRATNIAAAIENSAALIPPGYVPQIVLLTDGRQTRGDALQTAARVKVPISTIPLSPRDEPEVQVAEVTAPAQVRQGEPFLVEVTLNSNIATEGFIDVFRGDILTIEQQAKISIPVGETKLRFRQTVEDERQVNYRVRLRDFQDTLLDNNSASAVVCASGKPTLLLVDSDIEQTNELRWALEEQGLLVQVRPIDGLPKSIADLQRFDCLVLSNVPATAMTLQQMEMLRAYVQELGGGLIMLGGDQAFGLGGYYKSTLEEILPVRSNFEKEKEKPSLAMVLVIDKSGSMGGQKIELAKDAAKGTAELLAPRDQLGVIAFDGASYWVSEIHSAADKGYIVDRISTIEPSGGTNIYPGLSDAHEALMSTNAKLKHVILLTDGHSQAGDFDGVVRDMVAAKITLSTVAVGSESDTQLLEDLAQDGGGRYYFCDDAQNVPQIFAKETVMASKSAINELPFLPQLLRPTQVLSGIDMESAPFLLGYVVTRPKPTSELILASEAGDPLLAWWRYGLGMTVAFTSDAKSRWSAEWLEWPQFGTFWAQVARHAMRKSDSRGVFVEIERSVDWAKVVIDAIDERGQFLDDADTRLTVLDPDLERQTIDLQQTAPGKYEAVFRTGKQGDYSLEMSQTRHGEETFRQTRGLVVGYPDELRLGATDEGLLRQISQVTAGQYNPDPSELTDPKDRRVMRAQPVWPQLLVLAVMLLVMDVVFRRIDLSLRRSRRGSDN